VTFGSVRLVMFGCAAFSAIGVAQAQNGDTRSGRAGITCFDNFHVARDSHGQPIILNTDQLDERATRRVMPKCPALLKSAQFKTHGKVKLLINASGEVSCAVALSGHPIVLPNVLEAIKKWRFRPYVANGQRSAVLALFDFCFSTSGCPFMDLQQPSKQ
jgi:hypothetical protein